MVPRLLNMHTDYSMFTRKRLLVTAKHPHSFNISTYAGKKDHIRSIATI